MKMTPNMKQWEEVQLKNFHTDFITLQNPKEILVPKLAVGSVGS